MTAELPDGTVLRRATDDDVEQIVSLSADAHGDHEGVAVRVLLEDPTVGPDLFTVVVDGDRVVSTLCLLSHTWRLDGVEIPIGRPEYVATVPDRQRRGYVRAQLDEVHRWSDERGDLAQMITGIGYVYRRFGYEYAISMPRGFQRRPDVTVDPGEGWEVRPSTLDDLPAITKLHEQALDAADVAAIRTEPEWTRLLTRGPTWGATSLVATHAGEIRGAGIFVSEDGGARGRLWDVAGDLTATRTLVHHADAHAGTQGVIIHDRPGTAISALLAQVGTPSPDPPYAYYVRVGDPLALLDHLRPALTRRLGAAPYRAESGTLTITLYQRTLELRYQAGEVVAVEAVETIENPFRRAVVGVAPDRVATLFFGKYGALDMAERFEDVHLARDAALMETLFPRLVADVHPPL